MAKRKRYYGFRLKDGCSPASFMADGQAEELANDGDVYKTDSSRVADSLRLLPFLDELGAVDSSGKQIDGPVEQDVDEDEGPVEGVNPEAEEVDE